MSAVINAQHMKQQYADVIDASAVSYEGLDRPDIAEALRKGYAESGYAGALRLAAEVELAKHGNEGGVAFDAAFNYTMAGDRGRALDWLEKAYEDATTHWAFVVPK